MSTPTIKTVPKVTAAIKARNLRYRQANAAGKRVMIAKEILRLLKIGTLKPRRGNYLDTQLPWDLDDTQQAQPYIAQGAIQCTVCAKGAMFIAAVSIGNKLKLEDVTSDYRMENLINNEHGAGDTFGLVKLFGSRVVEQIEYWFEKRHDVSEDAYGMLEVIMKNIVENKGKFVPEQLEE